MKEVNKECNAQKGKSECVAVDNWGKPKCLWTPGPPTTTYSCNTTTHRCIKDPKGKYTDINLCKTYCKKNNNIIVIIVISLLIGLFLFGIFMILYLYLKHAK